MRQSGEYALGATELEALILASARDAGLKGALPKKLGRNKKNEELFDRVVATLVEKRILLPLPGKANSGPKYILAEALPPPAVYQEQILERAQARESAGATLKQLKRPLLEEAQGRFDRAVEALVAAGNLVPRTPGKTTKYYARGWEPPTAAQKFAAEVFEKMSPGEVWLEEALAGGGKSAKAGEKRRVLTELAAAGKLVRVKIIGKAKKQIVGFSLPVSGDTAIRPEWLEIEQVARELAARRFDGTISFEELAERLGTSVLYLKTAILQQLAMMAPIRLVVGDPREVQDPASSGIEQDGVRYLRFRFQDS